MLTPIVHRRRSSVWRPTLDRDCTHSAVLVALQLNAERSSLKASSNAASTKIDWAKELDSAQEQLSQVQNSYEGDTLAFRFPSLQDRDDCNIFDLESDMDSASEHTSPVSDTTLFDDDLDMWPIRHSTDTEFLRRHTAENNVLTNRCFHTTFQKAQEHVSNLVKKKNTQHSRHSSSSSKADTVLTRNQLGTSRDNAMTNVLTAEEREMEYKHHHTFIGTASLNEFLELLEISPSYHVSQSAVVRAFARLASTEQLYARQHSTKPDGWGLVARTSVDYKDVATTDYVMQSRVKLGTITLLQFLSMIPFNQDNMVGAMTVLEAFSAASHLDAKTNMDAENKAKAFRSWIISQRSTRIAAG